MLDDVAIDPHGNILVTDLDPSIHALMRMNLITGKRETLASQGFGRQTRTGVLGGARRTIRVTPRRGAYSVSLPKASAALLTLR